MMDADPYWTRAWPSAIALAATLLRRPELVRGRGRWGLVGVGGVGGLARGEYPSLSKGGSLE